MARLSTQVSASATAAITDLPTHDQPDDTMSLDVPEQLLTPENSRSETSSNNENALAEEKPAPRRRSTRVARASLQAAETLEAAPVENEDAAASTSQAYVDSLAQAKRSRSSLRHSIAVMESSIFTGTALPKDDTIMTDSHPMAPDTPVSKSSQEPQVEDMATSLQQRTLRKRVEKALAEDAQTPKAKATPKSNSRSSVRRSTRLSIVEKASDLLDRANSVLGKRSRDLGDKGKEIGRRASLRPRTVPVKEDAPAPAPEPAAKKRRVSESDLSKLREEETKTPSEEPAAPAPPPRYKPKRWLTHGLYTGQEPSDSPPKQRRSKNSAKTTTGLSQRRLLPMPMFTGSRIVSNGRDYVLPFDIFSPLPPGQPKPDEWRKTNKNVFVGDAASEWKANKKLELSTCMCEEETGCDENCQNRYMFYECDSGNCRLGPECGNRNFNELKHRTKAGGKYNIGVEVIKTTDRGYGVRSNRTFEPNQIIVEYTGEIITQFECERRMRSVYKNNECYYLMYFDQNMIIDATRGSIARFVNHSCEPNCRMEKWTVAGKPRMALFAGDRGIMTGEELSYDYNFDPYSNKNVQQCRCGSDNCRGILGPRPKDKDQRAKLEEKTQAATKKVNGKKRKMTDAESTTSQKGKKRKLLTPKSIKAGVKKAVAKATSRGKAATKKTTKASAATSRGKAAKNIKLPKVKTASRVKAAVQKGARSKAQPTKAAAASSVKGSSPLKRPSPETKKKILARAKGGSRPSPKKSPAKAKKTEVKSPLKSAGRKASTKSPVKARMPISKARKSSAAPGPKAKKTLTGSVKKAAKSVVRTVRGKKN
ncbi:uncharacterized protein N7496_005134 [Penicillium cataractarum]|uniref:Histone-lysine N-methyltransferase (Ash1) n=1 Tax=Penicillium cataractarum TaxID=2100454 RepID=A0A9W9VFM6_9EURO|nr:uncharacterized protein N7496_005134 [Penicillium cataractarum]KAJ5377725.1 hypothetical protein N7496_005134 [Penicillium cataractarum]